MSKNHRTQIGRMILIENNVPLICNNCSSALDLEVHHKNKDFNDNSIDNLEYLCEFCHKVVHGKKLGRNTKYKNKNDKDNDAKMSEPYNDHLNMELKKQIAKAIGKSAMSTTFSKETIAKITEVERDFKSRSQCIEYYFWVGVQA